MAVKPAGRGHVLSPPGWPPKRAWHPAGSQEAKMQPWQRSVASELLRSGPGMPFSAPGLSQPLALQRASQTLIEQHLIKSHHL